MFQYRKGHQKHTNLSQERKQFINLRKSTTFMNWKKKEFDRLLGICPCCNKPMTLGDGEDKLAIASVDHILELDKGGRNVYSNFRLACRLCNNKKDQVRMLRKRRPHTIGEVESLRKQITELSTMCG